MKNISYKNVAKFSDCKLQIYNSQCIYTFFVEENYITCQLRIARECGDCCGVYGLNSDVYIFV